MYIFLQTHVSRIPSLTSTGCKTVFKLTKKLKKKNRCYSFSCDFPVRYVNGCPESKILISQRYPHLQLLPQTTHFTREVGTNCLKVNLFF